MPPKSLVDQSIRDTGVDLPEDALAVDTGPVYRVSGDAKIPVSKTFGKVWEARKDQGMQARGRSQDRWDEAIRYYENDQIPHRKSRDNGAGNTVFAGKLNNEMTETENVVFSNCAIMVPMLYPKNPKVTFTYDNDAYQAFGKACEHLVNKLFGMKEAPGLSLKTKMRRTVLTAQLTNRAYIKLDWIYKQDSSQAAVDELKKLGQELSTAKDAKAIREIEGKLQALEEKVSMLSPAGPKLTTRLPHHIVVDPTGVEPDLSDAQWLMDWDYLPTNYINAVYGEKQDNQWKSVYEPTHVLLGGKTEDTGIEDEINNFSLIQNAEQYKPKSYGFDSAAQLEAASYTKIWYVWDKTTRRVFLFADNNWKWPIWVWEDPLRLPRFFPYFPLWFHESVNSQTSSGEVTYYLDQQDAINEINDEARRGRLWAKRNVFFDKNSISQEDVQQVLKGPDGTARGIKLPEGKSLQDVIYTMTPPALKFPELFNTENKFAAINRITGINDAMRGAQFKTNTTNQAIDEYNKNTDIRVDERVDLIEDFFAAIGYNVAALCAQFWSREDVEPLIGTELALAWQQVTDPLQFNMMFTPEVQGGSTEKPNTKAKKQQALQLGQVLGQFASTAPGMVLVMLKMIEHAFDEVDITDEDWAMINQTMMMNLQQAGAGPGGQPQAQGDPAAQSGAPPTEDVKAQVQQKIASLAPQQKQELQQMIQQGVPPAEALAKVSQPAPTQH